MSDIATDNCSSTIKKCCDEIDSNLIKRTCDIGHHKKNLKAHVKRFLHTIKV